MAIFKTKKTQPDADMTPKGEKKRTPAGTSKKIAPVVNAPSGGIDLLVEDVIVRPHITEKASVLAERNMYVFEVSERANKSLVKTAIKEIYKVNPIKVNIINIPPKNVIVRGVKGTKAGKKKAVVHLKEGESIEII